MNLSDSNGSTRARKRAGPKLSGEEVSIEDINKTSRRGSEVSSEVRSGRMTSSSNEYVTSPKDFDDYVTPVLAIAIRRNAQDKAPIVQFNGIITNANKMNFIPFTRHISTQTYKSNVHVEFELNEPAQ